MLQFENLCAGYDGRERLHRFTSEISAGSLTAVIGPNGCGKTTLIRCAAGLLKPASGCVRLAGRDLCSLSDRERARRIAYMPQSRITPDISVRQLVTHGRYPHMAWGQSLSRADRDIVEHALRRTGMLPFADRSAGQLSGGERQRAYLAMMLAQQTPVMLLDEPTTYLDLSAQFSMMELLRALCREGRCALVVLHDLALALEYADRVLLMQEGCLIGSGTPDDLFRSGAIREVFHVNAERIPSGKYVFSPRSQEV